MAWLVGYPREKVNWYPRIDLEKCSGCGMCLNCGKKVFGWRNGKAKVVNPFNCVVGCSTCKNLCPEEAISFPPVSELRELYRREGIWEKVTRDLKEKGVIPPD